MTRDSSQWRFETKSVHAGYTPEPTTHAVAVPLYQTVAYSFDSAQHGADLFDLKVAGNIYTRIMNPTQAVLEERIAALEGGIAARWRWPRARPPSPTRSRPSPRRATTSSPAARLYGGTYNLFAHTPPQYGIQARFADYRDPKSFEPLIDARTKAVFVESLGNPQGNIDIAAIAAIAHAHGVPLIVDNTVPSPYLCRPFEHGADIVVHSLTKYLGGHGTSIGGAIVDSGKFPWAQHKARFKRLNEPDVSYHGVVYTEALGRRPDIGRARVVPLRNMGAAISPFNAWQILQGVGDAGAAHGPHLREHAGRGAAPEGASQGGLGQLRRPGRPPRPRPGPEADGRARLRAGADLRREGGRAGGERFLDALQLFTRWSTSAIPSRSPRTRPRPRTASSRPRS